MVDSPTKPTSRQTQTGIRQSIPAHRGGQAPTTSTRSQNGMVHVYWGARLACIGNGRPRVCRDRPHQTPDKHAAPGAESPGGTEHECPVSSMWVATAGLLQRSRGTAHTHGLVGVDVSPIHASVNLQHPTVHTTSSAGLTG